MARLRRSPLEGRSFGLPALGLSLVGLGLGGGVARAHSPHDVCNAVGVDPAGGLLAGETGELARFDPLGVPAGHLPSPGDTPRCVTALGEGAWLLVTDEGGAWRSDDDARSFTALAPLGALACAAAAGGALVAGEDGLWWVPASPGAEAELLAPAPDTPLSSVAEGADGVPLALDEAGHLLRLEGGALETAHPGPWTALAAGGGVVLLGAEGRVATWDGAVATPTGAGPIGVHVLAAGEAAWLAAGEAAGPWLSEDAGETWTLADEGMEALATGSGGPADGVHEATLIVDGERLIAATFEGLYLRELGDAAWWQLELRTSPFVRSLQWLDDGGLLIAPYGAGVARGSPRQGAPGTGDWHDVSQPLRWPWLRRVAVTEGGGPWWAVGGKRLYRSTDQGLAWDVVDTGLPLDGDALFIAPGWPADARLWSTGLDEAGLAALAASGDGGESWALTSLGGCREKPSAVVPLDEAVWVACSGALYRVEGGRSVALALPDGVVADHLFGSAALAGGDRLLVSGEGGLWSLEGGAWVVLLDEPTGALIADGDSLLVATDHGLTRLEAAPGGGAPTDLRLGWPVDDLVSSLAVSPEGRLAAGTFRGAWTSEDGGATWALATDLDRYDDLDQTWRYEAGWRAVSDEGAKAEAAMEGEEGAAAEWSLAASGLSISAAGEGRLAVSLDQGPAVEVKVDGAAPVPVWAARMEPGMHRLRLSVRAGTVRLDGGQRWRLADSGPEVLLPTAESEATGEPAADGCGCASGAGARPAGGAAALGLVAGLLHRLRRRPTSRGPRSRPAGGERARRG